MRTGLVGVGLVVLQVVAGSCGGECTEPGLYICVYTLGENDCPPGLQSTWTDTLDADEPLCETRAGYTPTRELGYACYGECWGKISPDNGDLVGGGFCDYSCGGEGCTYYFTFRCRAVKSLEQEKGQR